MAAFTTIAAIGGLALAAAGTVKQISASKKAAKAQKREAAEQQALQDAQATRERQKQVRAAVRKQGIIANSAAVGGLEDSSGAQGALSNVSSETGNNLNFLNTVQGINANITSARQDQIDANSQAQFGGAVAGFGTQVFSAAGGFSAFNQEDPNAIATV